MLLPGGNLTVTTMLMMVNEFAMVEKWKRVKDGRFCWRSDYVEEDMDPFNWNTEVLLTRLYPSNRPIGNAVV